MGILRTDRVTGLGGANAISGSVFFTGGTTGPIITISHSQDFAFDTSDFTIEFWIKKQNGSNRVPVFAQQAPNGTDDYGCWIELNADNTIEFQDQESGAFASTGTIKEDTWTHVVMVRDSNTLRWFIDGVASGTSSYSGTMKDSKYSLVIGRWGESHYDNSYYAGYISNLRIQKGVAQYTSAFTPPTNRLEKTPETVLLCCQSSSDVTREETGKILIASAPTNGAFPQATHHTPNSPVGFSTTTDVGSQYGSTFDGFGSFATSTYMVPSGGNTRERNRGRGLIMGGAVSPGATNTTQIKYFDIAAGGITEDFGQTTVARRSTGSFSSSTRALMGGGFVAPTSPHTISDVIDFVTIANTANAIDFGNMQSTGYAYGTASNETRGLFAGGYRPNNGAVVNTIDLITIATAGNASNFGDLTRQVRSFGGFSSSTRGVFAGGTYPAVQDVIDFVTFSTTGDATDFGNLTDARDNVYGSSSSTRGVIAGGRDPNTTNIIDFITIATAGNAIDFGDLSQTSYYYNAATSNSTKAVWIGNGSITNAAEFVTIATTGNATDFGDQNGTAQHSNGACSDSHGGL